MSTKPDDAVAALIVQELSKHGLVSPEKATAFLVQLSEGRVSSEDWARLAEQQQERQAENSLAN